MMDGKAVQHFPGFTPEQQQDREGIDQTTESAWGATGACRTYAAQEAQSLLSSTFPSPGERRCSQRWSCILQLALGCLQMLRLWRPAPGTAQQHEAKRDQ